MILLRPKGRSSSTHDLSPRIGYVPFWVGLEEDLIGI